MDITTQFLCDNLIMRFKTNKVYVHLINDELIERTFEKLKNPMPNIILKTIVRC